MLMMRARRNYWKTCTYTMLSVAMNDHPAINSKGDHYTYERQTCMYRNHRKCSGHRYLIHLLLSGNYTSITSSRFLFMHVILDARLPFI